MLFWVWLAVSGFAIFDFVRCAQRRDFVLARHHVHTIIICLATASILYALGA